jgi:hypothetical protein
VLDVKESWVTFEELNPHLKLVQVGIFDAAANTRKGIPITAGSARSPIRYLIERDEKN